MEKKRYNVVVHFEGSIEYEVEADNEEKAKEKAEEMFGSESDAVIAAEIADCGICDCWEVE